MASRLAPAILAIAAIAAAQSSEPKGAITVKVIDQQGNPVSEAVVRVNPPRTGSPMYVSNICKTDTTGTCTRSKLPIATYLVDAKKPSDGYPDLSFAFYGRQSMPILVTLTLGSPNDSVVFQLGAKAASLKLNVLDDATSAPIDNATIILLNPSDAKDMVGIGRASDSTVLIPPDKDVQIQVTANGYQSWKLIDHAELTGGKPLHLRSGDRREMTIRLKHQ